jgi:hypothetical protein
VGGSARLKPPLRLHPKHRADTKIGQSGRKSVSFLALPVHRHVVDRLLLLSHSTAGRHVEVDGADVRVTHPRRGILAIPSPPPIRIRPIAHLPTAAEPRTTSPAGYEPKNKQQHNGTDEGVDDQCNDASTQVNEPG